MNPYLKDIVLFLIIVLIYPLAELQLLVLQNLELPVVHHYPLKWSFRRRNQEYMKQLKPGAQAQREQVYLLTKQEQSTCLQHID